VDYNDRLLLGLKGTMSEAELHLLKQRMLAGKQARRGGGAGDPTADRLRAPPSGRRCWTPTSRSRRWCG